VVFGMDLNFFLISLIPVSVGMSLYIVFGGFIIFKRYKMRKERNNVMKINSQNYIEEEIV